MGIIMEKPGNMRQSLCKNMLRRQYHMIFSVSFFTLLLVMIRKCECSMERTVWSYGEYASAGSLQDFSPNQQQLKQQLASTAATTASIRLGQAQDNFEIQSKGYSSILKLQRGGSSSTETAKAGSSVKRANKSKKKPSKSRIGSLHSSSQKTATGKKKVGSSVANGKQEQQQQKKSSLSGLMEKYKKVLPLTRAYITMVGVTTIAGLVLGEELAQGMLALDPIRTLYGMELWRPFTAGSFLGPPSIGWLMNGYYLFEYGSSLERAYGSAQHAVFLVTQIILLSLMSILLGQPFFASSMITAMLHVLSRSMPHQNVKWLVFTVPYWSLPYGLMATDVLQAQSGMAAIPHIMGILSGHFYQFHKFVWPKMGTKSSEDWLIPPSFVQKRLDPAYAKSQAKESIHKALQERKKKKGRKLGSK